MSDRWEYGISEPIYAHIDAAFGGDCTSGLSSTFATTVSYDGRSWAIVPAATIRSIPGVTVSSWSTTRR